jgi:hypothetical protein
VTRARVARFLRGLGLAALACVVAGPSCVSLDGFFFNPTRLEGEYTLPRGRDGFWPADPEVPAELRRFVVLNETAPPGSECPQVHAVWARRPGDEARTAPTVLYHHGNAANIDRYWERASHLWALGENVLIYDYPGYGRTPGSPSEAGIYCAARAALAYLRGLGDQIDQSRLFHYGFSLGSAPATELAASEPSRGLILEAPFTSVAGLAADGSLVVPRSFVMTNQFDNRGKIRFAAQLMSRGAPLEREVVLIFHGTEDDFVQTKYGQQLFETIRQEPPAGNARLVLVPGANHGDVPRFGEQNGMAYSNTLRAFFNQP